MTLITLVYVGLPLLLALVYWRNGQRTESFGWFFACTVIPLIIMPFAVWFLYYGFDHKGGPATTNTGLSVGSLMTAGLAWLLLTLSAFFGAPILSEEERG